MALDRMTRADLKFNHLCPHGLRVRLRPLPEIEPWLAQQPHLRDQLDTLDRRTAYSVDMVYEVSTDVIMLRLYSFSNRWFNAFLFEEATAP